MKDFRMPGIIPAAFVGWLGGMYTVGGLGMFLFGPINGNPDIWAYIGGPIGAILYIYSRYDSKAERSEKGEKVK